MAKVQVGIKLRSAPQLLVQLFGIMMGVDGNIMDALGNKVSDHVVDCRFSGNEHQRFRFIPGERLKAGAQACG